MCREKEKDASNDCFLQKNEDHHWHMNPGVKVITWP